jgi:hypothetical protein
MNPSAAKKGRLRNKLLGAGAIGLLALGIWIGSWLPEFGLGGRRGVDDPGSQTAEVPSAPAATDSVVTGVGGVAIRTPQVSENRPPLLLTVMIHGEGFQLPRNPSVDAMTLPAPVSEHFEPATLEEVVAQAQQVPGNAEGIKVLILRHKSATVGARERLLKALLDAGLKYEELHALTGFVD